MEQWVDLQGATWRRHESVNATHAHADIYEWPYGVLIACKGTSEWGQIWDYALHHRARNLAWNTSYVHEVPYDFFSGGQIQLQEFMRTRLRKPVTVVGHSLGGSLAKLTASFIVNMGGIVKEVVTFGAPRFESDSFTAHHSFTCFCIENYRDPVCYVPTRALPTIKGPRGSLFLCWFPRKYGRVWNIRYPSAWNTPTSIADTSASDWKIESWLSGQYSSFWRGNEPEALFGLPAIAEALWRAQPRQEGEHMYGSRYRGAIDLVHQSPFYLWLTSAMCSQKFSKRPIGVCPGDTIFKRLNDAVFLPEPIAETLYALPAAPPPSPGEPERTVRLRSIGRRMGRYAKEEFIRREFLRPRQ